MSRLLNIFILVQIIICPISLFGWTSMTHVIASEIVKSKVKEENIEITPIGIFTGRNGEIMKVTSENERLPLEHTEIDELVKLFP